MRIDLTANSRFVSLTTTGSILKFQEVSCHRDLNAMPIVNSIITRTMKGLLLNSEAKLLTVLT